ncbi:hypothetical protein MLD38_026337 [Melastoma candidum]|uniref:Uncharacterized protein n=1 Tax=Melastoma candidum TaxID=119954 RepID=A0ACB9NY57_9MYRT|nr:hypothetical protein MLD38_026337 [Melastoma candidum]
MSSTDSRAAAEVKQTDVDSSSAATVDLYSVQAAEALASNALHLPITEAAPLYEQLLVVFPTAAKYWKQYVEALMVVNNDDATKQIFSRCLLTCLHIPLWRCYIRFVRKVNEKKGVEGQEETRKAFEFMLSYVGADIASGPVWMEYITFLKSLPAVSALEDSQRMTAVRKVYQKAIVTPSHHIEQLWRDYENFENSVSRQLAKGLVSEYQPKYNSARAVYRERKKYVDEIDWNMLAVPPKDSSKEETQWMAWKRFLAFEKTNPQRIDAVDANKRIVLTYEQCLMYLYHYPDVWYDYATWHAKAGATEAAIKVFQRALKALPRSQLLRYAYAEYEESRGAIQPAKKVYETLLTDGSDNAALAHIQYIRFLRRTEGVEAAKKYFLDARKSPSCTYQVYVAYAKMAFCLDKEPKVSHSVFEAGLMHFMHEPLYIIEYADFLSRLNDDKNIRALFERALSSLPPGESAEVWKRFVQFEQTYGDLASMLKIEQRRKEALAGATEDGGVALEGSLQDLVSRYSFMDLWPCSSGDLDHLSRQEWLARNLSKKTAKAAMTSILGSVDRGSGTMLNPGSTDIVFPDTSLMAVHDHPRQKHGRPIVPGGSGSGLPLPVASASLSNPNLATTIGSSINAFDDILKATPPSLLAFLANLPSVEGPTPDADIVLSICLQSNLPAAPVGKVGTSAKQLNSGHAPSTSEVSGSSRGRQASYKQTGNRQAGKRKNRERQDDDETTTVQSQPMPTDIFRLRQIQKARATSSVSQTGSTSYGSALSGDLSGNTS